MHLHPISDFTRTRPSNWALRGTSIGIAITIMPSEVQSSIESAEPVQSTEKVKLLFVVTDDGYFFSHRLPIALAARRSGYEVGLVAPIRDHGPAILQHGIKLHPIQLDR